jgi:hypothetical protein
VAAEHGARSSRTAGADAALRMLQIGGRIVITPELCLAAAEARPF